LGGLHRSSVQLLSFSRITLRSGAKYGTTSKVVVFLRVAADAGIEEEGEEAAADGNGAVDAVASSFGRILSDIFS
jgi:hypothetical protein